MEIVLVGQTSKVVHIFYKTTNLVNHNFYYGVHSTSNIKDTYLGSGLLIEKAIKKYGRHNFKREILKIFNSRQEAYDYERLIVNQDLLKDRNCYNRAIGGRGGYLGPEAIEKMRKSKLGKPAWNSGTAKPAPKCLDCHKELRNIYASRCKKCSLTSGLNPACLNRIYITPVGIFKTKIEAAKANGMTCQSLSRRLEDDPVNFKVQNNLPR